MSVTAATETFLLELNRRFDAPPDRLFRAMTEPELIRRWFGPEGTRCDAVEVDLRVGGAWSVDCADSDGKPYRFSGVYREIERPHRLVKTWILPVTRAETVVTLEFRPNGEGTALSLHHDGFPEAEFRDRHGEGWSGSLDKLARL